MWNNIMSVENSLYSFDLVVRVFTFCYKINTLFNGYWKPHCFELAKNAYCFICFIQVFIKNCWFYKQGSQNNSYFARKRFSLKSCLCSLSQDWHVTFPFSFFVDPMKILKENLWCPHATTIRLKNCPLFWKLTLMLNLYLFLK